MADFHKTIEDVTGIPKKEQDKIWLEVKENQAKLNGCPGPHDFVAETDPPTRAVSRYRCRICGGHVNGSAVKWYHDGLRHAKLDNQPDHG